MRINKVRISVDVERKIYDKHTVSRTELEEALVESAPLFFRAKEQRYLALVKKQRHLSIIFTFEQGTATIVTAYPSSDWQVKLYKRYRSGDSWNHTPKT